MGTDTTFGSVVGEESEEISRLPGLLFKYVCLGATLFGLLMVGVLLVYVALDAVRPFTADPAWHLTFLCTLVIPTAATSVALSRRDSPALGVGWNALGVVVAGLMLGAAAFMLFVSVYSPVRLFAVTVGAVVAVGAVGAHLVYRPRANGAERLAVMGLAAVVGLTGLPPVEPLGIPRLLSPLWAFVLVSPFVPTDWMVFVATLAVPAAVAGVLVARGDDALDRVTLALFGGLVVGATLVGAAGGPFGVDPTVAVLVFVSALGPLALYVDARRRRESPGLAGLSVPVVVVVGLLTGVLLTRTLGFAAPDAWLDWGFLTGAHSRFAEDAGFYPPMVGSVMMLIVITVSAFPIGVGAAIYLEEYAPSSGLAGSFVRLLEINIGNLAGVPSVVYGLLGLAVFIRRGGLGTGIVVVGGMTVGLLILPIVIISAQEALRAVPDSRRQASYGMGATRWQTIRNVVLPDALPGILTGTILAFGRAIGETAPLIMIGAATTIFSPPGSFFSKFSAMPKQIHAWVVNFPQSEFQHGVMAAGVVTLLVVLLSMNAAAIVIRNRYQRQS